MKYRAYKNEFWNEKEAKELVQILSFYNVLIEKPKIKHLSNILLCTHNMNGDIEYAPVYFNSATKTVINFDKYDLDKSFQEILYRIDNWIKEGDLVG